MLDGEGRPRFIWRTTEVTVKPLYQSVSLLLGNEGEGDRTREWWLDAHRRYFSRQASRDGFEFEDDIPTVFERFEVVLRLRPAAFVVVVGGRPGQSISRRRSRDGLHQTN